MSTAHLMKLLTLVFITQSWDCGFPGLEGKNAIHYPSPRHNFADRGEIFLNEPLPAADKAPCFLVSMTERLSLFSLAVS